jgi:hypothetical protein
MARPGRPALPAALVFIGIIGIFQLIERPRYQLYHAVDVVQLVASGMCFGVALAWVIERLRSKPPM